MAARVALVAPVLARHDAIGIDTLESVAVLRRHGAEAHAFAPWATLTRAPARDLFRLPWFLRKPRDTLVYQFSYGWPGLPALLERTRHRVVIRHHNVTPPSYFAGHSAPHVAACEAGLAQLAALARRAELEYIADSEFNARELVALGVASTRIAVVHPLHRVEQLVALARRGVRHDRTMRVLAVGRLAPSKGQLDLVEALAALRGRIPDVVLEIVGKRDARLGRYVEALEKRCAQPDVAGHVRLTGAISDLELARRYAEADLFVSASRHEGFCVPLVEAMAFGVPIVAIGAGAVPETVGPAAICVPPDPEELGRAMIRVLSERVCADALSALALERFAAQYASGVVGPAFVRALQIGASTSSAGG